MPEAPPLFPESVLVNFALGQFTLNLFGRATKETLVFFASTAIISLSIPVLSIYCDSGQHISYRSSYLVIASQLNTEKSRRGHINDGASLCGMISSLLVPTWFMYYEACCCCNFLCSPTQCAARRHPMFSSIVYTECATVFLFILWLRTGYLPSSMLSIIIRHCVQGIQNQPE